MPGNTAPGSVTPSHTEPGTESTPRAALTVATTAPGSEPLDAKAEAFAQAYAGGKAATDAYRLAYDVADDTKPMTVRKKAHVLRHSPPVAARIRALQNAAAQAVVFDVRDRMADLADICTADASEISRVVTECCRCCHGDDGKPQWRDEAELQRAVERAVLSRLGPKPEPMPEFGGFGFDPSRPPADDCRACGGHGLQRVVLTPTDQLSGPARKLFKSARQKADGSIEIELESRQAASEQLARLAGWNIERIETKSLRVSMTATEAAAIAARPVDEIVRLLFPNKAGAPT